MKNGKEGILSVFGIARRANILKIGQDIVKSSLARGEELLVVFASEPDSSFYRSLRNGRLAEKKSDNRSSGYFRGGAFGCCRIRKCEGCCFTVTQRLCTFYLATACGRGKRI